MHHSNKIYVSLRRAIRELKIITHESIPNARNVIQLWKHFLKGLFPTLRIMPKTNLGVVTHLKTRTRKLLPPLPNEFQEPHPMRPKNFITAPPTPQTAIFHVHYLSPESLSLIGVTP
jgi:hypothetical protein